MANGCSICEPAPSAKASGSIPNTAAMDVNHDGPQAPLRGAHYGFPWRGALGAELLIRVQQRKAVMANLCVSVKRTSEGPIMQTATDLSVAR